MPSDLKKTGADHGAVLNLLLLTAVHHILGKLRVRTSTLVQPITDMIDCPQDSKKSRRLEGVAEGRDGLLQ